jgi:LysR family cys regulon transcriptional activator
MREVNNLKRIGHEFSQQDAGTLSIATTHNQARYVLPGPIAQLRKRYPKVNVSLHQGTPEQVAKMLLEDVAEVGLATESLSNFEDLVTLPCYEWHHVVVVPPGHALAQVERLTLQQLAQEPLISYHPSFAGRSRIDQTFAAHKLKTNVVLEAIDADVIKTYVRLGLGVGIVSEMAVREDPPGGDLVARPAGHLFGPNVARLAFKRGAYLRSFVYAFAQLVAPRLSRPLIEQTLAGQGPMADESL